MGRALKADGWGLGSVTPPGMVNMEEAGAPHGDGAVRGMVTEGGLNCKAPGEESENREEGDVFRFGYSS